MQSPEISACVTSSRNGKETSVFGAESATKKWQMRSERQSAAKKCEALKTMLKTLYGILYEMESL